MKQQPSNACRPQDMPPHFFHGVIERDYATAIPANTELQDFTVFPRAWYVDARFHCADCGAEFLWSAQEQKLWFEVYHFYVDSQPTRCRECHAKHRNLLQLRQEYDALIGKALSHGTVEMKERVLDILEKLEDGGHALSSRMRETRDIFCRQLTKHDSSE